MSQQTELVHGQANSLKTSPTNNKLLVYTTILLFVLGAIYLANYISGVQASLYIVGGVLGVALFHAHYGFTSSFRAFLTEGRGVGLRAQMILFGLANLLFLPFLLKGEAFGHALTGYVQPVGVSLLVGAFIFGIGMQMGDGCASGTLYHIGGGDGRGVVTLVGFVIGSVIGSAHFTWWTSTPHLEPISFLNAFGPAGGLLFNLLLMAIVFIISIIIERRRRGSLQSLFSDEPFTLKKFIQGPWSWMTGTVVLAIGSLAVLLLSGKPWGVTYAFVLWGAKISRFLGIPVEQWGFWQAEANANALNASIFQDVTTVLNFGVMLGALLAVALSTKAINFSIRQYPAKMIVGLLIGGILMGYGARLAFGCNIGAYFAGIASFSLHGWIWMIMAMLGSIIGIKFRTVCGFKSKG
ncbi:MAG TPA: YeeE/YedE family protein [Bacillus sp. (in: firmicutes)]|nr:YeeE/YedE family protein [Bacillus sp. (in: firmicutes)]